MKYPLPLFQVLLLLAAPTLPAMTPADAPVPSTSGGITEIVLEQSGCRGSCPTDTLVLHANGMAEYTGKQNTRLQGEFAGMFSRGAFDELAKWLVAQGFFELQDTYGSPRAGIAGEVIRVARGGERKSVIHQSEDASLKVWSMKNAIRAVAADIQWQPAHSGIRGQALWKAPGEDWRPRPDENIRIAAAGNSRAMGLRTDREGRFQINLEPGTYSVSWQYDKGMSQTIVVEKDRFAETSLRHEAEAASAAPRIVVTRPPSFAPEPPGDGLYVYPLLTPEKWMFVRGSKIVRLGERTEPAILGKRIDSSSVDNSTFQLTLTVPFDATLNVASRMLIVGDSAYQQSGLGSNGRDQSTMHFPIPDEQQARELAKYFGITVERYTRPDYRLSATFTPTKASFARGEPVTAKLRIVNAGTGRPEFWSSMRTERRDDYTFTASRAGQPVTDVSFPGTRGGTATLSGMEPGGTFEDTVDLGKWFEFKQAGTYLIHGSYQLNFKDSRSTPNVWLQWTEQLEADFAVTIE